MKKGLYDIFRERYGTDIYIYSDFHFSDLDCYKLRFPDRFTDSQSAEEQKTIVDELDKMQITNCNKKCSKNSTLIVLGDVGDVECVKKLKAGYKVLIMGNHDKGASNYKKVVRETKHNSDICPKCGGPVRYDGRTLDYCGFGYAYCDKCGTVKPKDDKYEDNHLFDEVYEGTLQIGPKILLSHEPIHCDYALNIHGHCHDISGMFNDKYHLNMCAEWIDYKPQNLAEIVRNGYLKEIDDIHRQTIDRATLRKEQKMHEITAEISYIDTAGNYGSYTYTYKEPDDVCIYNLSYSEMKQIFEDTALPNEKLVELMKGK